MDREELDKTESIRFKAIAARANCLAQDSVDVQYSAKEVWSEMAVPTKRISMILKRLVRHLVEYTRLGVKFRKVEKKEAKDVRDVCSDSGLGKVF